MGFCDDEETKEVAEAKEEMGQFEKEKEQLWRQLTVFKEKIGDVALKRVLVQKMLDIVEMESGGDETLFILEENGFESLQRVKALDGRSGVLHDECAKSAVELWINRISVGAVMDSVEMDAVLAKLGFLSKECGELYEECAKSAAELCIKKMRFAALVYKCDKRTILQSEIDEARGMTKELKGRLTAFKRNLMSNELSRKQDSEADVTIQENDVVGGEVMDDKPTKIVGHEFEKMECGICKEKVPDPKEVKGSAFEKQSFRVLLELMKGVKKVGPGPGVDEAIALVDEWAVANTDKCLMKVTAGVLMDKHCVYEVMKNEIVEAWRVEKQVKDRFVINQMKQFHALGSKAAAYTTTATVEKKNSGEGSVVRKRGVDERKHVVNDGFGLVWENVNAGRLFAAVGMVAVAGLAFGLGKVKAKVKDKKW